jgi:hypothetical protein
MPFALRNPSAIVRDTLALLRLRNLPVSGVSA